MRMTKVFVRLVFLVNNHAIVASTYACMYAV